MASTFREQHSTHQERSIDLSGTEATPHREQITDPSGTGSFIDSLQLLEFYGKGRTLTF